MRVTYDSKTETLTIIFNENQITESDEEKPGIILDFDKVGKIVSMEILDASSQIKQPTQIVYELAGY